MQKMLYDILIYICNNEDYIIFVYSNITYVPDVICDLIQILIKETKHYIWRNEIPENCISTLYEWKKTENIPND